MNKILNLISEYFVHLITNVPTILPISNYNYRKYQNYSKSFFKFYTLWDELRSLQLLKYGVESNPKEHL